MCKDRHLTRTDAETEDDMASEGARNELGFVDMAEGYRDEFGFVAPAPVEYPSRRIPESHFPTGPGVGDQIPAFQLPNQHGELINFHAARGQHKAALVFHRSAVW